MNLFEHVLIITAIVLLLLVVIVPTVFLIYIYRFDSKQEQHSILRNYPILGKVRYFFEMIGPEMRQYLFDGDRDGKPFSRTDFLNIVLPAKYLKNIISYGSKRDFEEPGYFIKNAMFPKQRGDMLVDNSLNVATKKYLLEEENLFSRKEKFMDDSIKPWLLDDRDAIVIGPDCRIPFAVKGQIGMSAMSYGALGENAITALSQGLGMAGGTWMNTGEGGLSPFHLKGGVDIIMQIGPGLFGVRTKDGQFSWEELRKKSEIPQIRAFELKLAQGAKARGGHLDGSKVSEEIALIRGVEPFKTIDSPNRFDQFSDAYGMIDFIERMREVTGKPVGVKIVVGGEDSVDELAEAMKRTGKGPDFITVDGGEGGTGATYQELADSVGLPVKSALMILNQTLIKYGVRQRVKIIASGKLFTPDRVAVALAMGADLVNIARGFMIAIGCIGAQRCHTNHCPVGVATTDPKFQKALVVEEKHYRVLNYVTIMREGLFTLAAAAGIDSPARFDTQHVVYKDREGRVRSLKEIYRNMFSERTDAIPFPDLSEAN
ncbi:FMN-binding glutamate synthase family protein [Paenibacillus sp. sptzw28]|uniref:FMN-binding glutamate synthase family protein n=1 Tax=Paenibacillus sp. sptzw28 TaxID=715179 RepID=UPI001C6F117F|nr:FMN-binding glutamate synthase family protein [Paenibacillus sp. sptzw28]QYR20209.1 FMN-binding glutamate synthase family protein [Paenibacillus sp. sptzw28]